MIHFKSKAHNYFFFRSSRVIANGVSNCIEGCIKLVSSWFDTFSLSRKHSPRTVLYICFKKVSLLRSKSGGFTLIETLLALAVMAMMLAPLYMLQASVVRNTYRYARNVERIMQAKLFLVDTAVTNLKEAKTLTFDKKINDPAAELKFEQKKVGENSALKKFKNVLMQRVSITWTENRARKSDALVTFVFRPEPATKEEKK